MANVNNIIVGAAEVWVLAEDQASGAFQSRVSPFSRQYAIATRCTARALGDRGLTVA
mgnify:CR=1 FL=1